MLELIALIILLGSMAGIAIIIFRKMPVLSSLPESPESVGFIARLKKKASRLNPLKNFSYEIFLQKVLTKLRILSLKADNKTFNWLQALRKRQQKNGIVKKDNYWEKIKKEIKK